MPSGRRGICTPLLIIAIFVVVFQEIHLFQDGNGLLSRVLTTLLVTQAGYAYMPYGSLAEQVRRLARPPSEVELSPLPPEEVPGDDILVH